ncbi:uncharacterized protein THITE_2127787 [Thermothielavioides terrestris NRRL 8126]|uniref:Uncharacterized protein n=1 Tax=Thermothielavioides terrestris (strain ATCC 38088 / NRRL 8126) TaxID=578455 RepID=G2R0F3_THETT|nr:uncharacterized protein THITE_2127787 [Thermothielavioides terrestris NRRL 8126]AEO65618.1 hypothetical protein THITE_2127787 [Thermothielavioides terrestris NRRL 8126]
MAIGVGFSAVVVCFGGLGHDGGQVGGGRRGNRGGGGGVGGGGGGGSRSLPAAFPSKNFKKLRDLTTLLSVIGPLLGQDLAERSPPQWWLGHLGRLELATVRGRKTLRYQEHPFLKLSVSNESRNEEVGIKG